MIRGLFLSAVNQGIAAAYLIVAVIVARLLLRKAPKSVYCILWMLVGIRLIMPFSVVSVFSLIPSSVGVHSNRTEIGHDVANNNGHQTGFDNAYASNLSYIDEGMIWASGNDNASEESVNRPYVYFSIASVIWLVGIGLMLLYLLISWFRVAGRVRFAIPIQREGIKYYQCEKIASPFLFGFFKTRIYVPSDLSAEDLSYVLEHEIVHRQRRDYLIKPVGYVLLAVYWFHPLVWVAYILLCRDIELACDERVIRELGGEHKKEYALALLSCSVNHRTIAACPVAFGEIGVKGRVKNVLRYKRPTFWGIAAAVAVCLVIVICFMTEKVEADAAQSGNSSQLMENEVKGGQIVNVNLPAENIIDAQNYQDAEVTRNEAIDYVIQWAEAFCSRNGEMIVDMTDETVANDMSDALSLDWGVDDNNESYVTFGWSSPWPWGGEPKNYRIVSASDNEAVILYYAWVSDPHVTVWREELSYMIKNGEFKVTSHNIEFLQGICVAEEFYKAYPDGVIDDTMMDYYAYNQAGEALNNNAKNPDMASGAYAGLDAPDTAAIILLNILQNENKVIADVEYINEEKTQAIVTFTFLENSSTAKVRMIKPYGADSIWLPQTY